MSALPLRFHAISAAGSYAAVTDKKLLAKLEDLFLGTLLSSNVVFSEGGKQKFPKKQEVQDLVAEFTSGARTKALRSDADNGLRVDHEVDMEAGLGAPNGGGQVQNLRWSRFEVQNGDNSSGGIAIPLGHSIPFNVARDHLVISAQKGIRTCIWVQNGTIVTNLAGQNVVVDQNCVPIPSGTQSSSSSSSKKSKS